MPVLAFILGHFVWLDQLQVFLFLFPLPSYVALCLRVGSRGANFVKGNGVDHRTEYLRETKILHSIIFSAQ